MNAVRNYQKELDKVIANLCEAGKEVPTLFLHSCCAPCSSYVLEYLRKYFRITVFYYNPNITEEEEYRKRVAEQKRLIAAYNGNAVCMENRKAPAACSEDGAILTRHPGGRQGGCTQDVDEPVRDAFSSDRRIQAEQKRKETAACGKGQEPEKQGYYINVIEGDYEPQRFYGIARGLEECPEGKERCFACYALRLGETAKRARDGQYDYFTTTLTISPLKNAAKLNEIGEQLAREYGIAWLPSDFKKKNGYKRSIELSKEYDLYRQDYCGCIYSRRR